MVKVGGVYSCWFSDWLNSNKKFRVIAEFYFLYINIFSYYIFWKPWSTHVISYSQGVWRGPDRAAEDHPVSWVPWGVWRWTDLLLAHPSPPGPEDPPPLHGVWCRGWYRVSGRLLGGLRQLRWRIGLCWEVRKTRLGSYLAQKMSEFRKNVS